MFGGIMLISTVPSFYIVDGLDVKEDGLTNLYWDALKHRVETLLECFFCLHVDTGGCLVKY